MRVRVRVGVRLRLRVRVGTSLSEPRMSEVPVSGYRLTLQG